MMKSLIFTVLLLPALISANVKGRPSQVTPVPPRVQSTTITTVPSKVNPDRDIYSEYGDFSVSEESLETFEEKTKKPGVQQPTVVPYTIRPTTIPNNGNFNRIRPNVGPQTGVQSFGFTPINSRDAFITNIPDENRNQFITERIPNKYPVFSQVTTPKNTNRNPDNFIPEPIPNQPNFYKTVAPRPIKVSESASTLSPRFFGISPSRNLRPDFYNNRPTKSPENVPIQYPSIDSNENSGIDTQSRKGSSGSSIGQSGSHLNSGTNNFGNTANKNGPISTTSNRPFVNNNNNIQSGPLSGTRNEPFGNTANKNQIGGINNHGNTGSNNNRPNFGINNNGNSANNNNKNGSSFGINNHENRNNNKNSPISGNQNRNNFEEIDSSNGPIIGSSSGSNSQNRDQIGSNSDSRKRPMRVDENISTTTLGPKLVIPWNAEAKQPNSGVQIVYAKKPDTNTSQQRSELQETPRKPNNVNSGRKF